MSHPVSSQEHSVPEDGVTHYPKKKSGGPLHNVADRLSAKAKALKTLITGEPQKFRTSAMRAKHERLNEAKKDPKWGKERPF